MRFTRRYLTSRTGQFILFKYTVYSLLAFNVYLYALHGTFTEMIDTAAWVVILGLFEWETGSMGKAYTGTLEPLIIGALSLFGYGVVVYSCYSYFQESEWLDFANALTWILVVLALQYDVYFPGPYHKSGWKVRNLIKGGLYAALLVFAIIWGIEGEVLDFYDAFLWMLAFVLIELNVFNFVHRLVEAKEQSSHE